MPLLNRIALMSLGMLLLGVGLGFLAKPHPQRNPAALIPGLLLLATGGVNLGIGAFGYRRREGSGSPGDPPAAPTTAHPAWTGPLACSEVGLTGTTRRVVVDPEAGAIRFEHSHAPRRFLAFAREDYACRLVELLAVSEQSTRNGHYLLIVTPGGKALVGQGARGYGEVRDFLLGLGLPRLGGPEIENPRMALVFVFGAMAGIFAGWGMTPVRAPLPTLLIGLVAGGALGVGLPAALVVAGDRWLGVRLVGPLLMAFGGVVAGAILPAMLVGRAARDFLDTFLGLADWGFILAAEGGVLGGVLGLAWGLRSARSPGGGTRGGKGDHPSISDRNAAS